MPEIVVVAKARVKEGSESAVEQAFREVMPPTHEEEGCLRYALHRGTDDPRTFMMIERWTSKEALDAHLATGHVQKLFASLAPLVEAPPELFLAEPLSDDLAPKGRL